ncbi:PEP-utilizing enzyme [Thermosynechococcus sp. PP45]|uniref:putative PEP-binding protein n=1 Tax=unclassified Thermosynechococcus TaxID=2622553 RepID=UPI002670EB77|nr:MULTISPECIES: putative PEP-binding protein [unclassified Thermosynechococcus]MDR5640306.1 putative PEP-binding protein [Thermosynechococcus sp. PP42]WKT81212.1 PEP-utilizing enzyme [Thermosynechococcus sp. PP45]WNC24823.1 putative PEP-binding protein [Thermosynechococcus sp. PP551]WNC27400.1 putative PEP-binding protein [Thermosynechococcus sp. PP555]WNC60357.1 putative PEP-binding protein [Thermosynechococcus sp. QS41]
MTSLLLEPLQQYPAEALSPTLVALQEAQKILPPPHPVWLTSTNVWQQLRSGVIPLWHAACDRWQEVPPNAADFKALALRMTHELTPLDVGELETIFAACHHFWQQQGGERHLVLTTYLWQEAVDLPWGLGRGTVLHHPSLPLCHQAIEAAFAALVQAKNLYTYWQQGWDFCHLKVAILLYPLSTIVASGWWTGSDPRLPAIASGVTLPHHGIPLPPRGIELTPAEEQYLQQACRGSASHLWVWHRSQTQVWWGQCLAEPLPLAPLPQAVERTLIAEGLPAAPGQAIAPALVVTDPCAPAAVAGQILVSKSIPPHWLPLVSAAVGVICEQGGLTSHGAILARELGRPAVVGVVNATQQISSGMTLFLDGHRGSIYQLPPEPLPVVATPSPQTPSLPTVKRLPLPVMVNVSQVSALRLLRSLPCDGIGLLRSELMLLAFLDHRHPCHWLEQGDAEQLRDRWVQHLCEFMRAIAPRPLFYRTLDLRPADYRQLLGGHQFEPATDWGLRGVSRYRHCPELFHLELSALAIAHRLEACPLRIILPFVRSVSEVVYCQKALAQHGLTAKAGVELWVMAEVPAILFLLSDLANLGVAGITIGTNDLTQLLLGIDRETTLPELNEDHPAVRGAIAQLIQQAKAHHLGCHLCGEAPTRYPHWLPWLIDLGIDGISVSPEVVTQVLDQF